MQPWTWYHMWPGIFYPRLVARSPAAIFDPQEWRFTSLFSPIRCFSYNVPLLDGIETKHVDTPEKLTVFNRLYGSLFLQRSYYRSYANFEMYGTKAIPMPPGFIIRGRLYREVSNGLEVLEQRQLREVWTDRPNEIQCYIREVDPDVLKLVLGLPQMPKVFLSKLPLRHFDLPVHKGREWYW